VVRHPTEGRWGRPQTLPLPLPLAPATTTCSWGLPVGPRLHCLDPVCDIGLRRVLEQFSLACTGILLDNVQQLLLTPVAQSLREAGLDPFLTRFVVQVNLEAVLLVVSRTAARCGWRLLRRPRSGAAAVLLTRGLRACSVLVLLGCGFAFPTLLGEVSRLERVDDVDLAVLVGIHNRYCPACCVG
jgi:hypothetical protein